MNGELAQVIALALHGSAWLADPSGPAPALDRTSSTFQYVARVQFRPSGATSSADWFASLRSAGGRRLWLVIPEAVPGPLPAHHSAGFSNGGRWSLLAAGPQPTLWSPTWRVVDRTAPDNRIWGIDYQGRPIATDTPPASSVPTATAELVSALTDIREVARDHSFHTWAERFSRAIDLAVSDQPVPPYHPDLAPPGRLTLDAARLLAAATQAWVFGGMGSWNDLYVDDQAAMQRMEAVTVQLYGRVLAAFVAAANAEPG